MTIFDWAGGAASDAFDWTKGAAEDVWNTPGELMDDHMNVGKNRYKVETYTPGEMQYGGQYGADGIANMGFGRMNQSQAGAGYAQGQMMKDRGAQAWENQALSDQEAHSRGWDQAGSLQLAREAAMGMAPSQAGYQLQAGLDKSLAQQSAMSGGARGAGGIALASANANASGANLQNQAFTEAGRLRAQEMGEARGLYGGLAGSMRQQDQNRLQMGNQMSQFNAQQNDQWRMGMGQLANQYNQSGLGWYQAAQNPYNQQGQMDVHREQIAADSFNQAQAVKAGQAQANAQARAGQTQKLWDVGTQAADTTGKIVSARK